MAPGTADPSDRTRLTALLLPLLLVIGYLIYRPGLTGPFILDDWPNLNSLTQMGGVHSGTDLWRFITNGISGPSGRPLSLLSFVLNDPNGPADPTPFKYTNILLHLLNGVMLLWLTFRLGGVLGMAKQGAAWLGLSVSALWLLHPLNVSTVLYVIQRMTELMTLFVLGGTLAYVHGRLLVERHLIRGYAWMSAAIVLFAPLATLCKENGALLPLYCLVIEHTIIRARSIAPPRHWRRWAALILYLPLFIIAIYFIMRLAHGLQGYALRNFTLGERLLTEPRILWDYLLHIAVPTLAGSGLFHDDYPPSQSLLTPWQTLPALLGIFALIATAVLMRHRLPVVAFAIAWFLAGHLLESSFLPLELYFEHRNYLPMLGPLLAVGYYALQAHGKVQWPARGGLALLIVLCGGLSWQQSRLWGDEVLMSNIWASENPKSMRAQQLAANYWALNGKYDIAQQHLHKALQFNPKDMGLRLQLLLLDCLQGTAPRALVDEIIAGLTDSPFNHSSEVTVESLAAYQQEGRCPGLKREDIHRMISALIADPKYRAVPNSLRNLYYLQGTMYGDERRLNPAMEALDHAFALVPDADIAMQQAVWLATAGLYDDALRYVEKARRADKAKWWRSDVRRHDIDNLEKAIIVSREKAAAAKDEPAPRGQVTQ